MKTIGDKAESKAAKYLRRKGYIIVDRNWKTRACEIDIIAKKKSAIHFVEVKYRSKAQHGSGFDYINSAKVAQMQYAAEYWVSANNWEGEYYLSAVELSGDKFKVDGFVEVFI